MYQVWSKSIEGCHRRKDGWYRYYIPSQLRWRGDNNVYILNPSLLNSRFFFISDLAKIKLEAPRSL